MGVLASYKSVPPRKRKRKGSKQMKYSLNSQVSFAVLLLASSLATGCPSSGTDLGDGGGAGTGGASFDNVPQAEAGAGWAGTGTEPTGTAGTGEAGVGAAGSGELCAAGVCLGEAGTGAAGTGSAGEGSAGTGSAGAGAAGSGSAGTGSAGTGAAGTGLAPLPTAGTGATPDRTPAADNPAECPDVAPDNPVGDCLGLPVYVQCKYGTYVCVCDWYHWLCAG
jgi:PPE-repeat protein